MQTLAQSSFAALDWAVLAGYFILLAVTGWWFAKREPSGAREYFLAGRQMPMWAVAISVLASATSAATFIGAPQEAYQGNLTYISTNIGMLIAVAIVAVFFIPAFYRHNVTTVYDLLEVRFGPSAKEAASWTFLIGRVFASGSRLFMSGIPLSLILFGDTAPVHLIIAIAALTVVAILYTLVGGIRSIIWTDVIQTCVFVGAAGAALVLLLRMIPGPIDQLWESLRQTRVGTPPLDTSKLTVLKTGLDPSKPGWGFDPSQSFTLLTAIFGFSLLGIGSYGTDHDLAQRMLTCRSSVKGSQSVIVAILINLPVLALFMAIGLLLYVLYLRPDLMGARAPSYTPEDGRQVFLTFILREMPAGMSGLMMAGLFAAGLGSCNSAINAMAAAFVNDCFKRMKPGLTDRQYLGVGRMAVIGWGLILGVFACGCVFWQAKSGQTLIGFALGVMTFAYAGLLGVFFTAIFTKRGSARSAIAALITGFVIVTLMQPVVFRQWASLITWNVKTPTDAVTRSLADVTIAFPWHLLIGTIAATAVCCLGKREGGKRA
jgi:solute:Na+ symporter, SSS family